MSNSETPKGCGAAAGPQHESIARFAGTWRAEVRLWMGPAGEPNVSHGTMTSRMIMGDRFLQQEYHDDAGMFEGRGFWGYNDVDERYEGFWIDVMANFFQLEYGQLDAAGKVYEMRGSMTNPQTGHEMQKRSVITYVGPDEHTIEMYFGAEQGELKAMEIRYQRA